MYLWLKNIIQYYQDKQIVNDQTLKYINQKINWRSPQTYNDYINIAKIDPEAKNLWIYADKYEVRKYIKKTIGSQYLNKLYGVYQSPDEIELNSLPKQFVLKTTHGSGFNIICKDKCKLNWEKTKKQLNQWLNINYYSLYREGSYRLIKPQIICEKYLKNKNGQPIDYKFFCWHGEPRFIEVEINPYTKNWERDFYNLSWQKISLSHLHPRSNKTIPIPENLCQMINLTKILSANFIHARIDLYKVGNKIYFGEITFTPGAGFTNYKPRKYAYLMGQYFKRK